MSTPESFEQNDKTPSDATPDHSDPPQSKVTTDTTALAEWMANIAEGQSRRFTPSQPLIDAIHRTYASDSAFVFGETEVQDTARQKILARYPSLKEFVAQRVRQVLIGCATDAYHDGAEAYLVSCLGADTVAPELSMRFTDVACVRFQRALFLPAGDPLRALEILHGDLCTHLSIASMKDAFATVSLNAEHCIVVQPNTQFFDKHYLRNRDILICDHEETDMAAADQAPHLQ